MKTSIFLFVILLFTTTNIYAQGLEESFGGFKTNFQIYSDTTNLNVTNQMLIKRAEKKSYINQSLDSGAGYGYAYESFHLEFATHNKYVIRTFKHRTGRNNNDKLELTFYDSNNNTLATHTLDFSAVDLFYSLESPNIQFFYSIDLIDIPVVLLKKTAKINLIKMVSDKKQ